MLGENTRRINLENNISSAHRNASISSEVYEPGRGNCSQSHGRADRSACMPGTDKQVLCKSLSDPFLLINTLKQICLTKMTVAWENEQGVLYRWIWKSFMNFLFCFVLFLLCFIQAGNFYHLQTPTESLCCCCSWYLYGLPVSLFFSCSLSCLQSSGKMIVPDLLCW